MPVGAFINIFRMKVAVVLAGCGYKDGAEIREAVLSLWALSVEGADVQVFAPDKDLEEIDHLTGQPTGARRSVLKEAARIARSQIKDLKEARAQNFDALILPGGFGAAKNLCSFATDGANHKIDDELARLLEEFIKERKPIGAICIAPAIVAKAFQKHGGVKLTLGAGGDAAKAIEEMGAQHQPAKPNEIVVDADRKVVSTPAYMYEDASLKDISEGIHILVKQVLQFATRS